MELGAEFIDVTTWDENIQLNTGGTRPKMIVANEEGENYFFKANKVSKDDVVVYPQEFWAEIVSSKIGDYLGFTVLDYNIGYSKGAKQEVGCISKSMVPNDSTRMTEGKSYLTGYDPRYRPSKKEDQVKYTFQFIKESLSHFTNSRFIDEVIRTIIFDAIISNVDRHQENWAILIKPEITSLNRTVGSYYNVPRIKKLIVRFCSHKFQSRLKKVANYFHSVMDVFHITANKLSGDSLNFEKTTYAPIYDSGSSLGRELRDEKVEQMNSDLMMLKSYISKGTSEIRWEDVKGKLTHYELIKKIIQSGYSLEVKLEIERLKLSFDESGISDIINNIDKNLPSELSQHRLSAGRKELMIKLITLRLKKLFDI
jgi:hypothetical protein